MWKNLICTIARPENFNALSLTKHLKTCQFLMQLQLNVILELQKVALIEDLEFTIDYQTVADESLSN